jgi:putative ABC transport system ATP-binding protein
MTETESTHGGTPVIVVTHDHRALDVFDTIYEMEDGKLAAATPSSEQQS